MECLTRSARKAGVVAASLRRVASIWPLSIDTNNAPTMLHHPPIDIAASDRALARAGRRPLITVLLLLVAWGQELVDHCFFAGQLTSAEMLPGRAFLAC